MFKLRGGLLKCYLWVLPIALFMPEGHPGEMAECSVIHTFACKSRTALRMVMFPFPPALMVNSYS